MRLRLTSFRATLVLLALASVAAAQDPLPSWNNTQPKQAILQFVKTTTDPSSPSFIPLDRRVAAFDQDGTTWVEQPIFTELVFALDRIVAMAPGHPEWKTTQPFQAILSGDRATMEKFTLGDLEAILLATHSGMPVAEFQATVRDWLSKAKDPRWHRPYTELVYQPMLELMRYLRANGFKTYIVTGGGQDFVRAYAERVYGIPPDQVIGTALKLQYGYDKGGQAVLTESPKLLMNNDGSGKAKDLYLYLGQPPAAAFGNSTGDKQMLEYTQSAPGAHLTMLVLHDDPKREYAYGPADNLPETKIGRFTDGLYNEAKSRGWTVIRMKDDWKRIFAFEK